MTTPTPPRIECEEQHPALSVRDIGAAIAYYTNRLGFEVAFTWGDPVTFAGVNLGQAQIFLREGAPAPSACTLFFVVGDADELFEYHRAGGVEVVDPPEPGQLPRGDPSAYVRTLR
jgi:catechol 2,3-dioxygenase-like lactoylglutathione lyase family enzyme